MWKREYTFLKYNPGESPSIYIFPEYAGGSNSGMSVLEDGTESSSTTGDEWRKKPRVKIHCAKGLKFERSREKFRILGWCLLLLYSP